MNTLQILGYIGLAVSCLVGAVLLVKIIILMCQNPKSFRHRGTRQRKKSSHLMLPISSKQTEGSLETASMYSEYELTQERRRHQQEQEQSNTKSHSKSDSQMITLETFKGSSFSKKSLQTHTTSDSGISNEASRSGVSTVWCETYPKENDNTTTGVPLSPMSRSSSNSSHRFNPQQEQVLNEPLARSLSPFSHQLSHTESPQQGHSSNYAFSPEIKSIDDVDDDSPVNPANNFQVFRQQTEFVKQETKDDDHRDQVSNAVTTNVEVVKKETEKPKQDTTVEIETPSKKLDSKLVATDDSNCYVVIVTVATKTKIVGYCLNLMKQKCSFYSYNIELLPIHILFKVFKTSTSTQDDYSTQNLKFALLLWRKKIAKYHRFRLYTDHPSVTDSNSSTVKDLSVFLNHLQVCEGKSILVNPDSFLIKPQEAEMFFGYRRYIQPAMYLQSDQVEAFEDAVSEWLDIPIKSTRGTHYSPTSAGGNPSIFDSSATRKFYTYFDKVQQSLEKWDHRTCQCPESTEQAPTYIS